MSLTVRDAWCQRQACGSIALLHIHYMESPVMTNTTFSCEKKWKTSTYLSKNSIPDLRLFLPVYIPYAHTWRRLGWNMIYSNINFILRRLNGFDAVNFWAWNNWKKATKPLPCQQHYRRKTIFSIVLLCTLSNIFLCFLFESRGGSVLCEQHRQTGTGKTWL